MNQLQKIEQAQIEQLTAGKTIPVFAAGDTIRVNFRIVEGTNERVQAFEGICIARSNRGLNSSFTVRKLSHGEGVERVFPLYSPRIDSLELVRRGDVRRAKLYYLRGLTGKAARITEKKVIRTEPKAEKAERVKKVAAPKVAKPVRDKKAKKAAKSAAAAV